MEGGLLDGLRVRFLSLEHGLATVDIVVPDDKGNDMGFGEVIFFSVFRLVGSSNFTPLDHNTSASASPVPPSDRESQVHSFQ